MKLKLIVSAIFCGMIASCQQPEPAVLETVPFSSIEIGGELKERVLMNFNRLEEEKYQPQNVYLNETLSGNWPGDTEGRTILGLVLDAQATGRTPQYLEQILDLLPEKLNEKGYMGPIYDGKMNEQQLSGNGWMLRGLCEYYEWTGNEKVLEYIRSIAMNLFVAGKGYYAEYPIDPDDRDKSVGGEAGTSQVKGTDKWILSSDIGCVFIGMEGAIHAYKILQEPQLKEVIEEMLAKLKQIDVVEIKAQTHATLTAARGLVRYAGITGDKSYIDWAEELWNTYKENGMTESHANYNWFNRFDTWTEPCAIVDSYMLAVQLWMNTENPQYKEDAELIYYNAICHGQRANGGFGTDSCPGLAEGTDSLSARSYEAHWCCTMRGGEGLGSAVRYSVFTKADTVYVPFLHECKIALETEDGNFAFAEQTAYPFGNEAVFTITDNEAGQMTIKFPHMSWMIEPELSYNGETVDAVDEEGFLSLSADFETGDVIRLAFKFEQHREQPINKANTSASQYKIYYGPLLLGVEDTADNGELTPVYHMMDPKIKNVKRNQNTYHKRILFED